MLKHRGFPGRLPGSDFQFTIRRANPRGVTEITRRERFRDRRAPDKKADQAFPDQLDPALARDLLADAKREPESAGPYRLVREVGRALGQEARSKRAHLLLAPTVNLHRSPLGGRHFEAYSEDPFLTACHYSVARVLLDSASPISSTSSWVGSTE